VFLLVLLVSNVYAAEDSSSPAAVNPENELVSGATNSAISNGILSRDALANDALANSTSNLLKVEPLAVSKRSGRPDNLYRASQITFLGSVLTDLGTTWNLPKGKVEGNPLLGRSKAQQASVSGALAFFTLWEAHSLQARGNTRAAKYLLWMGSAAHAFAGTLNTR
jgi:hypothetical protein